jgi:hypothetical protein
LVPHHQAPVLQLCNPSKKGRNDNTVPFAPLTGEPFALAGPGAAGEVGARWKRDMLSNHAQGLKSEERQHLWLRCHSCNSLNLGMLLDGATHCVSTMSTTSDSGHLDVAREVCLCLAILVVLLAWTEALAQGRLAARIAQILHRVCSAPPTPPDEASSKNPPSAGQYCQGGRFVWFLVTVRTVPLESRRGLDTHRPGFATFG